MLNKTAKTLIVGVILMSMIVPSTLVTAGYKAAKVTYDISGSIGVSGVSMVGLPGNPVSDKNGFYTAKVEYGWSGTVKPIKEGHTFEPMQRQYESVTSNQANQLYKADLISLTVYGSAGTSGVAMKGLPGNPVSDENGNYSTSVKYGWTGTVIPVKEGHAFKPVNVIFSSVTRDQESNYASEKLRYVISGSAGIGGAVMDGLPNSPVTDINGNYKTSVEYGWNGSVRPFKEGYVFEPSDRTYSPVAKSQISNYSSEKLRFTISGSVGVGNVVMSGLPSNTVTNANGDYSVKVDYDWNGMVTPLKEGYVFEPSKRIYDNIASNQADNYKSKELTYSISGMVANNGSPLSNVTMNGIPGNPVTDDSGYFSVTVKHNWNGTATPAKRGHTFTPSNFRYMSVKAPLTQNFEGKLLTCHISGRITDNGRPVSGVQLKGLLGEPVTNNDGKYTSVVDYGWNGMVTPVKEGYTFDMADRKYGEVISSQLDHNYVAKPIIYAISGSITKDGLGLDSVNVSAKNGRAGATTDANGEYKLLVNHGWSGTVTPMRTGHTFDSVSKDYVSVTSDRGNQNYDASLIMCKISGMMDIEGTAIDGVLMTADNGGTSGTTDTEGKYSVIVPYGWKGSITPIKPGFIFSPPSTRYINVTSDINERPDLEAAERLAAERRAAEQRAAEQINNERKATEQRIAAQNTVERELAEQMDQELMAAESQNVVEFSQETMVETTDFSDQVAAVSTYPELSSFEPLHELDKNNSIWETAEPLVSNVFIDTELRQVLQDISSQTGITIIPDQTVTGLITCELEDVPLKRALEIVLAGTGYMLQKTPDYYLISSPDPKDAGFLSSSITRTVKMNYVAAKSVTNLLSPAFKNYVQADPDTETVSITAPATLVDRIESDLMQIDQPQKHVMLDARIVVMERSDLLNLGVEWTWPQISAGMFTNNDQRHSGLDKWPWGVQIGYGTGLDFTNSLQLKLNLLEQNGDATIVSSPQILAQDGKDAEIKVTTEEYFSLLPKTYDGSTNFYDRAELEKIEYGTILNIMPHIGRNGDITLKLSIEVSDVILRTDEYPVVTRRIVNNTMRIKNGGTVSVAGLKNNKTYSSDRSTPGLSRLPLLGGLFDSKQNSSASKEVAIFVTAYLIPDTSDRPTSLMNSSSMNMPTK
jgi:type II secretory pathway component GspD/PulD (secretin)